MELIDGNVHLDENELDSLQLVAEDSFLDLEYSAERLRWLLEQMREEANYKLDVLMKRWNIDGQKAATKADTTSETCEFLTYKMAQLFAEKYLEELDQVTRVVH